MSLKADSSEPNLQLLAVVTGANHSGKSTLLQCLLKNKPAANAAKDKLPHPFPDFWLNDTHVIKTENRVYYCHEYPGPRGHSNNTLLAAADVAIISVDITRQISAEVKRLFLLNSLMRIPHVLIVVNKMDSIRYSREKYFKAVNKIQGYLKKLEIRSLLFVPVSSSQNENILEKSSRMGWFRGDSLVRCLNTIHPYAGKNLIDLRFAVEKGNPRKTGSIVTGMVLSGKLRKGDSLFLLPQGRETTVKSITTFGKSRTEIHPVSSATLKLTESFSATSGQFLTRKNNLPGRAKEFNANLFWTGKARMKPGMRFQLMLAGQNVTAFISMVHYSINVNTLHRSNINSLKTRDIGRVRVQTDEPIFFDNSKENRLTGFFLLKVPESGQDAAVGIIRGVPREIRQITEFGKIQESKSTNVVWEALKTTLEDREKRNGHKAGIFWFTGLSASGKSTVAKALESRLFQEGFHTVVLDGDNVRHGLCGDLGFSDSDRTENIRRVAEVAGLFYETGHIVLCTFISPFREDRAYARNRVPNNSFFEVYVKCNISICKKRDPKGLYKKAMQGKIPQFTGISSHYEEPENPDLQIDTGKNTIEESLEQVYGFMIKNLALEKPL